MNKVAIVDTWELLPIIEKEVNDEELFLLLHKLPDGYQVLNEWSPTGQGWQWKTLLSDGELTKQGRLRYEGIKTWLTSTNRDIKELLLTIGIKTSW